MTECPPGGAAPSERSASGLLEWESINDAMEALAMMNHHQMKNTSMYLVDQKNINAYLSVNGTTGTFLHTIVHTTIRKMCRSSNAVIQPSC